MKKLYKHQERFLKKNPDRALLVWETGTGKTIAATEWLKKRSNRTCLVICPKAIVGKWRKDLVEEGVTAVVISTDQIKVTDLTKYNAIVVDEAHNFASPLFSKQRSQRATKLYLHIKNHPDTHMLLLTATPIRSTPWNIHSLAAYLRHIWPVKDFREEFEYFTDLFGRWHYELKPDWRRRVRPYVEDIADIVLMKDCFDVPEQKEETMKIKWTKDQEAALKKEIYENPAAEWYGRHQAEQGEEKLRELKKLTDGYRKCIVVCNYSAQIDYYARELSKDRQVFVLEGSTKDQHREIEEAKATDDCIFLIQASMGAGFDASEFSVVIFASLSFKYIDKVQMMGRVKRANNLHENLFIYLLAGKNDEAVFKRIEQGKDFDVHHELK